MNRRLLMILAGIAVLAALALGGAAVAGSAGIWPYHDHSPSMMESIDGGMYGAISILGRHQRQPDKEFVVFLGSHLKFMTIDGRAFVVACAAQCLLADRLAIRAMQALQER